MPKASEQDFQAWEALIDQGVPFYQAAKQVGVTMTALGSDRIRREQGKERSRELQAAKVEQVMEEQASRPEPSPAIVTAWAKANHPDYEDRSKLEISGPDGGPIAIEGKAVVGLADVVAFARSIGYGPPNGLDGADAGDVVPPPRPLLPGAADDQRPAGVLPPAEGA